MYLYLGYISKVSSPNLKTTQTPLVEDNTHDSSCRGVIFYTLFDCAVSAASSSSLIVTLGKGYRSLVKRFVGHRRPKTR